MPANDKKYDSYEDNQGSVATTVRAVLVFCVLIMIPVAPIVYYHDSPNAFMGLMWMDSDQVMDDGMCATIGWRCK